MLRASALREQQSPNNNVSKNTSDQGGLKSQLMPPGF
jgi:hypothetical protein